MKLREFRQQVDFCFLNAIYVTEVEKDWVYEFVLTDSLFSDVWLYRSKISKIPELLKMPVVTDFMLENGFFMCTEDIPVYEMNNIVLNSVGEVQQISTIQKTMYEFLLEGVQNDFMFYDEVEDETIFTPFYKMKFSHSTMTAFYKAIGKQKMTHRSLVTWENMVWQTKPVLFASAMQLTDPRFQFVKEVQFNKIQYWVYEYKCERIVTDFSAVPQPLINKASLQSARVKSGLVALQEYCSKLFRVVEQPEPEVGKKYCGSNRKHPGYGVYITPVVTEVNKQRAGQLLEEVLSCTSLEELLEKGQSFIERWILKMLFTIHTQNESPVETLGCALETKKEVERVLMVSEMFLYRMRVFSYSTRTPLTNGKVTENGVLPIIHGSEEPGSSLIEGGFYKDGFSE